VNVADKPWIRPLNEIEAGNELVKIINSGEIEDASDYYNRFCLGFKWTPMLGFRIRESCKKRDWDPHRFGAHEGSGKIRSPRRGSFSDMAD
jgi:hypothetical protein